MLIEVDPLAGGVAPVLEQDLDTGDDGWANDVFPTGWTILDMIGINSDDTEPDGRLYADLNYGAGTPPGGPNIEPTATYIDLGYEIEYVGRWGDSTGSTQFDWHATNLTNEGLAGFVGPADFRQSGQLHDNPADGFVETNQGVPYGTLLVSLGESNVFYRNGDFNFDGQVDGKDFLIWQRNIGFGDPGDMDDATRAVGDTHDPITGFLDRVVDGSDLANWQTVYGTPVVATASSVIPEPSSLALLFTCLGALFRRRRS